RTAYTTWSISKLTPWAVSGTRSATPLPPAFAAASPRRAPIRPRRTCSGSRPGCARAAEPRSTPTSSSGLLSHQPLAHVADADAHDDVEATLHRDPRRIVVHDPFLEPQHPGAGLDRGSRHGRRLFGATEHVDDVDPEVGGDVGQRRVRALAEDLHLVRVDRDDPVSVLLEVPRHLVRGAIRLRRQPDHRNGVHVAEERPELAFLRRQPEVSHGALLLACSRNACNMNPVAPQIVASSVSYHHPFQARPPSRWSSRCTSIAESVAVGTVSTRAISARLTRSF